VREEHALKRVALASVIALAAATTTSVSATRAASSVARPNVLLIAVDNLGTRLGCYGQDADTPNIDRLARRGRRFDGAYCQYPSSAASRVSLLTGQRPETTRAWEPEARRLDAVALEEHLAEGGYFTARVGRAFGEPLEPLYRWEASATPEDDPVAAATRILETPRAQPFFLFVGLDDVPTPAKYATPYTPQRVKLAPADEPTEGVPAIAVEPAGVDRPGRTESLAGRSLDSRRGRLAGQLARASFVDAQVGALLDALERQRLSERTLVVLVGDRSLDLSDRGLVLRTDTLFEDSLRTPLVIAGPGLAQPGAAAAGLVELVDVFPTLAQLANLPLPPGLAGTSLVPMLGDPGKNVKTAAFSVAARDAGRIGRSVRTDRFRYNEWPDGSQELFDHEADPHEWTNLARSADAAGLVAQMRELLDKHEAEKTDAASSPSPLRGSFATKGGGRPNVLFLVLDDLSVRLGSYGYDVRTPHIDRLAGMGRRFDRAYCQAAMCNPSRASLLLSRRPERLEVWSNNDPPRAKAPGAVALEEQFRANGYFTTREGKIAHGRGERDFAWDQVLELSPEAASPAKGPRKPPRRRPAPSEEDEEDADVSHWWQATDNADADEPDGRRAKDVAQFLAAPRSAPFFLAVGFAKPHLRWVAPKRYFDLYPPAGISFTPDPSADGDDIPTIAIANLPVDRPGRMEVGRQPEIDDARRRQATAAHNACVTFVDAQIGVVLDALDRLKLWESTIVVLIGDHGYHLGEHLGLWRKDTLFEEAARAPLIVVAPGDRKRGTATRSLVELMDLYPTLTDLAGLPRPAGLQGASLVPLIDEPAAKDRKAAFTFRLSAAPRLGRSVRTDRYRFTEWPDGSVELYDLTADPGEGTNMAADPLHAAAAAELKALLARGFPAALASVKAGAGGGR
jgi:iduronate 2-sulfatase